MRYDMTAAETSIGKIEERDNTFGVRAAAQRAWRGSNPETSQSYDQILGRSLKAGVDLSGGECRVALARPTLRDAQLLIWTNRRRRWMRSRNMKCFNGSAELTLGKMALADFASDSQP